MAAPKSKRITIFPRFDEEAGIDLGAVASRFMVLVSIVVS
jgi:hypothetical protein